MARRASLDIHQRQRSAAKLMKRIVAHFHAAVDDQLRPHGATIAQVRLLAAIRNAPGSSGAQLSRECGVSPQSAQVLIQRAEEAGWIERGKDRVNGRIVTAILTSEGEHLLRAADRIVRGFEAKLWKGIRPAALDGLIGLLEQCVANVDTEQAK